MSEEKRRTPDTRAHDLNNLPRIDCSKLRWLYHMAYYDGPMSGMAIYEDTRKCFFDLFHDGAQERAFVLFELTEEQFEKEMAVHRLFQEHVGTHTDYEYNDKGIPRRNANAVNQQKSWDKFYKVKHDRADFADAPAIGWFTSGDIRKVPTGTFEKHVLAVSRESWIKRKTKTGEAVTTEEAVFLLDKINRLRERTHEIVEKEQKRLAEYKEIVFRDAMWYRLNREDMEKFVEKYKDPKMGVSAHDQACVRAALKMYRDAALENYELRKELEAERAKKPKPKKGWFSFGG